MRKMRRVLVVVLAVAAVAVFAAARRPYCPRWTLPTVEVTAEKPRLEMPEVVVVARAGVVLAQ